MKFPKPGKLKRKTKKKPDPVKRLAKELDSLWSKIVRNRPGHCQWCKKPHKVYHAHHIFSRRRLPTRWDLNNGLKLGAGCHRMAHNEHMMEFAEWVRDELLGEPVYLGLKLRSQGILKKNLGNLRVIQQHLEEKDE